MSQSTTFPKRKVIPTKTILDVNDGDDMIRKAEEGSPDRIFPPASTIPQHTFRSEEDRSSFLPRIFFAWASPMFITAAKLRKQGKVLEYDDLLHMSDCDYGNAIAEKFETAWDNTSSTVTSKQNDPTKGECSTNSTQKCDFKSDINLDTYTSTAIISTTIFKLLGSRFILAGFIKAANTSLQFSFPIILNEILQFIEDVQHRAITDADPSWVKYRGYWLSALFFLAMFLKALTESGYSHLVARGGYQTRIGISIAVYKKSLRLANTARQGTTLGELVNLMQVDASKIEMFIPRVHVLWDGLFQIVGYMIILYKLIGWPCFVGFAIMIVAGPVQAIIMKRLYEYNRQMSKFTDQRVQTTNEALQGIQSVKMYTWEESFEKKIAADRSKELSFLRSIAIDRGFSRSFMYAMPGVVAVLSFVVYAIFINQDEIQASTLFAALVAFEQMRFPLMFYPIALAELSMAHGSAARVEGFLRMQEVNGNTSSPVGNSNDDDDDDDTSGKYIRKSIVQNQDDVGILVGDATIYWHKKDVPLEDISTLYSAVYSTMTFTESDDRYSRPILKNLSFQVRSGELTAVIGRVASGKSTLCSALLNEVVLDSGSVSVSGTIAYAAQTPWILNATFRDNILFGRPYNQERYQAVIDVCQLSHDLTMLDHGDMTEIGERGINLSGGQKQRISVARAAYSDADIIILDDPLSALDPEVGRKLFEECIVNFLHNKTRFFATNQLQFLPSCNNVITLSKRRIVEQGSYCELMANEDGELHRLIHELNDINKVPVEQSTIQNQDGNVNTTSVNSQKSSIIEQDNKGISDKCSSEEDTDRKKGDASLISKEERNIGAVSFEVYKRYIQAGGGYFQFAIVVFAFFLSTMNSLAINSWVSYWTSDVKYEKHNEGFYLTMYCLFTIILGIVTFLRSYLLAIFGATASYHLHTNLLHSVLSAPQRFFDTTPIGRILSRFSRDMYLIDIELSDSMDLFLFMALSVATGIATILFVTPWFGIAVPFLGYVYMKILTHFRDVSRETRRLESISRSPVYTHFSETLGGLSTIHAYDQSDRFILQFEQMLDGNTRAYYSNKVADRWLSTRLEIIGATIGGLAAVFATNVAIHEAVSGQQSSGSFASLAGLSLNYAIFITNSLALLVRTFAYVESSMNSCERIIYYSEQIPQEASRTTDELDKIFTNKDDKPPHLPTQVDTGVDPCAYAVLACDGKVSDVPTDWPRHGDIHFNNLCMRYRNDTPLVLKGLNLTIKSGERIGIVGRTGSGKSSLLLTLLRLVEPDLRIDGTEYEAPIFIDGVDILRIGLKDLRSKVGIIPQNPVLFSGTIRSNIDPFDEYTDERIWEALNLCRMKDAVEAMPGELYSAVAEYGGNLSAGSRQMLVLGRAILRRCKILLLDEATSSVDYETDCEIQHTIRSAFADATVLTIAHRIETIMDSDKILVMKDGIAVEYDSPQSLLERDEESLFADIVRHTKKEK